tara:strand:- start:1450 stop:2367 length:918 start_codon:yes stop_codon:yes gene_type:complete
MSEFKAGQLVRRINCDANIAVVGSVYAVEKVSGSILFLKGHNGFIYNKTSFELAAPAFEEGQLVRRINYDRRDAKVGYEYKVKGIISPSGGISLEGLGSFGYDSKNFELVVAAPAFEEGQLVRRINNDCRDAKVGCVYTVKSGYATNSLLLEGHGIFSYDVSNFELVEVAEAVVEAVVEAVLELEQGKLYEFSDDLEFSKDTVVTAKFVVDLTKYIDDGPDYSRPLVVWTARKGVSSFKYARAIPLVACKVYGYNLMITQVEANAFDMLKVIQKDNYEANEISTEAYSKLQEDLVAKYASESEPF